MNQNSQSRNGFHKKFLSPLYTTFHLLLLTPTNRTINHTLISFPPIMTISKHFILTILIIIINVCTALWLTWLPSSLLVPQLYSTQFNNQWFLFWRCLVVDVAALQFVGPSTIAFFIDQAFIFTLPNGTYYFSSFCTNYTFYTHLLCPINPLFLGRFGNPFTRNSITVHLQCHKGC